MAVADDSVNQNRQQKNGPTNDYQENFERLITLILLLGTILVCVVLMYLHSNT